MAKVKFSLTAKPTFTSVVAVPVPGEGTVDVQFTFKGRTREQMSKFHEDIKGLDNAGLIMQMASGWELEEPFDFDSVTKLTENYLGATQAIFNKYYEEVMQARLGN
jgi:hypothetical protein